MNTPNALLDGLRAIVGNSNVLCDGDLSAWEMDWRKRERGKALAVVRPASTQEVAAVVKNILHVYKEDARPWERIADWVERIGWPRFFEKTGLPFTKYLIDDWRGARANLNASTHIRF